MMLPSSSQVSATSPSQASSPAGHRGPVVPVLLASVVSALSSVVPLTSPVVICPLVLSVTGSPVGASVVVGAGSPDVEVVCAGADVEPMTSVALSFGVVIAGDESSPQASAPRIATPPPATFATSRPNRIAETVSPRRIWW
ncbi:hypothetical protein [Nannocystis pusilla]|uniref:hypothetical protein n=1 Tax=Nannocystis pusilla TaxID=889268 RepID=UPI003B80716F